MDNIDRMMKEADRLGFGVSYGKYQAACVDGSVKSVSTPPKPRLPEKPTIPCRHCGKPFVRNHTNEAYCGPECRAAAFQKTSAGILPTKVQSAARCHVRSLRRGL